MRPFFLGVKPRTSSLSAKSEHRWYWLNGGALPDLALSAFWQDKSTSKLLKELEERYFGFLPEGVNAPILEALMATLGNQLQRYHETIAKASRKYAVDPLLLTAVIFQESKFDPNAVSHTGATGLLQFTSATAQAFGVNRTDPISSIYGGARYLRYLWDSLAKHNLPFWDRWFLALAAYNQGPAHVPTAMALAKRLKGDGKVWSNVKRVYPLLARPEYAAHSRHGTCRGDEAVKFVESVRYYYYVLNGLVVLGRPEAEHLAPLLAINSGWFGITRSGM
jgi:membrane-bound lytic murein transglycosylase F